MQTKKLIIACLLFFIVVNSHAQGVEKSIRTSASASQIYFEAGGSGIIYSINFDSRFNKTENGLGYRIGLGGAGGDGSSYIAVPVQINYLLGERGKYLELGGGITYLNSTDELLFSTSSQSYVTGNAVIGFRSQPFGKKGLTWRIAFTPFINKEGFFPFAGVSIGFRF